MKVTSTGGTQYKAATKTEQKKTSHTGGAEEVKKETSLQDIGKGKVEYAEEKFSSSPDGKKAPKDPKGSKEFVKAQSSLSKKLTGGGLDKGEKGGEAKEANYMNDPYLDHNTQTCNPEISRTPLFKDGKWNGPGALNALHQVDDNPDTKSDQVRCGASAILGSAVMKGPESVAKLCENLSVNGKNLTKDDQTKLEEIRNKMLKGEGDVGDMHLLQDMMYRSAGGKGGGDLSHGNIVDLQKQLGLVDPAKADSEFKAGGANTNSDGTTVKLPNDGRTFADPKRGDEMIKDLKTGESRIMNIDTDKDGQPNHYVTVGKDKDGKTYIYDPYPKENEPNVVYQDKNPDAFKRYTDGTMGAKIDNATKNANGLKANKINLFVGGVMDRE